MSAYASGLEQRARQIGQDMEAARLHELQGDVYNPRR